MHGMTEDLYRSKGEKKGFAVFAANLSVKKESVYHSAVILAPRSFQKYRIAEIKHFLTVGAMRFGISGKEVITGDRYRRFLSMAI
jgi:hypothetical protein